MSLLSRCSVEPFYTLNGWTQAEASIELFIVWEAANVFFTLYLSPSLSVSTTEWVHMCYYMCCFYFIVVISFHQSNVSNILLLLFCSAGVNKTFAKLSLSFHCAHIMKLYIIHIIYEFIVLCTLSNMEFLCDQITTSNSIRYNINVFEKREEINKHEGG